MKAYDFLCKIRENIVPLLIIAEKHNLNGISVLALDNAIEEFKEFKPATCDGCAHFNEKFPYNCETAMLACNRMTFPDRYKAKEQ